MDKATRTNQVTVFGPASLSNLGPGFDALGLCLEGMGDVVEAWLTEEPGVHLGLCEGTAKVPRDPNKNTATRAALAVLEQADATQGIGMRIRKGIPLGSGIGGSSASAVAGAWATNLVLGAPFSKVELLDAVMEGESIASGARHGDNVLPTLFGGLVLLSPTNPAYFSQIVLPGPLPIALVLPKIEVLTQVARTILPQQVPFTDAIHNAADLALMVEAFRAGDWERAGMLMMRDRLVEPVRAQLVPCYAAVRQAALEAGAYGCALTGSGPAMFALAATNDAAHHVLEAMQMACTEAGIEAEGRLTAASAEGVRIMEEKHAE
ncbi:MAG TPA: homoserine kinase [Rhodothermales bacterium]|nr:homoserine kinase [Rhodothermales bacterium]